MKFDFTSVQPRPLWASLNFNDWHSARWQMANSLKDWQDYQNVFGHDPSLESLFSKSNFQIRTTPYYASIAKDFVEDPIRKILFPNASELSSSYQQELDPLNEQNNNPVPRIIHRYSDRLLFLVTDFCSVYCRYCTRKHFTGKESVFPKKNEYEQALDYIKKSKGLREVILSGGDPLTLSNKKIEQVLSDLRSIEHVEIIRIGSRMPVVCPMRIDQELATILKKHKPVFMMTHFNHPREITLEAKQALDLLVDNGVPCFNQMVLLNGVNNHPAIVQALSRRLLYLRVKPYYMFQCDPSEGSDHLRNSIDQSLEIQQELWGHLSGLAMPNYAVDIPSGGGKTYYVPKHQIDTKDNKRSYVGWDGVKADYISPKKQDLKLPVDYELYLQEWEDLKSAKI